MAFATSWPWRPAPPLNGRMTPTLIGSAPRASDGANAEAAMPASTVRLVFIGRFPTLFFIFAAYG
jgi:hypothetical protein